MSELSYGAKLCPVCKTNEVVWAKKCKSCNAKDYYRANKDTIKQAAKARYKRILKTPKEKVLRIELHVYIHQEPANASQEQRSPEGV